MAGLGLYCAPVVEGSRVTRRSSRKEERQMKEERKGRKILRGRKSRRKKES